MRSRSRRRVLGPARRVISLSGADGEDFAAADGHGLHGLRLVFGKAFAGVDDAVEEDDVGDGGLGCGWVRAMRGRRIRGGRLGGADGAESEAEGATGRRDAHGRSLAESGMPA